MGTLDLNLVRVFVTVYETGGVTSAAEALHITQPTVSYGLGKLRRHFGDELFVREGRTLVPTAQAQRLYRQLSDGLSTIDGALHEGDRFDPATDATHFTLAMSDLGEATLLPRVLARMRSRAPHSSLTASSRHRSSHPTARRGSRCSESAMSRPCPPTIRASPGAG